MAVTIIAELSGSHCGRLSHARDLVEAAAQAGADAIKLQTFDPAQMVGTDYTLPDGPWQGMELRSLYRQTHTPRAWHEELFELADSLGLIPMSSPFHPDDVEFLESVGCQRYKIASFEACDLELLAAVRETGKPFYLSTGAIASDDLDMIWPYMGEMATLMHCTSAYPATMDDAALLTLDWLTECYALPVGLSDHTPDVGAAPLAVALGATAIEKHITQHRGGLDDGFALSPEAFARMVQACRDAEAALSVARDRTLSPLRRSVWLAEDVSKGTVLERRHLKVARPWSGISPLDLDEVVGYTMPEDRRGGQPPW
jgi:N-acetylneuraminate synthase